VLYSDVMYYSHYIFEVAAIFSVTPLHRWLQTLVLIVIVISYCYCFRVICNVKFVPDCSIFLSGSKLVCIIVNISLLCTFVFVVTIMQMSLVCCRHHCHHLQCWCYYQQSQNGPLGLSKVFPTLPAFQQFPIAVVLVLVAVSQSLECL